jgi:hypothetical protein
MRTSRLLLIAMLLTVPATAHAGTGIGLFLGEPTGFTLKADLQSRSSIEVLLGINGIPHDNRGLYGHFTFLVSPFVAHGRSVTIPFRFGIGGAVFDCGETCVAVRAPFEIAFQFHSAPFELYAEISAKLTLIDPQEDAVFDLDGGGGFRIYL